MLTVIIVAAVSLVAIWLFFIRHVGESFEHMLKRTEGVSIADITAADGNAPKPDPKKLYAAFCRGRARVAKLYPQAAKIQMSAVVLRQTAIQWFPTDTAPHIASGPGAGAYGVTLFARFIYYSFEEVVEHEVCHALVAQLDGGKMRTQAAIDNPRDADQKDLTFFFEILCHDTSDDPIGNPSGNTRADCIQPYSGPARP